MTLPDFSNGENLPQGVYPASLAQILDRSGHGTMGRALVADRLSRIYALASTTEHLKRFVVFGSFVTAKREPNDVDVIMIRTDAFDLATVHGEAAILFHHREAQDRFGASVFWTRVTGAFGGEQAMVEYWQMKRDGGTRGIVEIVQDVP